MTPPHLRAQAVEPAMKVDQESESKGIMGQYGPVIATAARCWHCPAAADGLRRQPDQA